MRTYSNPVRVHWQTGCTSFLQDELGNRTCLLVTSPGMLKREVLARVRQQCARSLLEVYAEVTPHPTLESVLRACRYGAEVNPDVIVALGGGSVIDTAKAISAVAQPGLFPDWLESHIRCGSGFPSQFYAKPLIAVPTTAGTGSEVTMWATLWDDKCHRKFSLTHESLYPEVAFVDSSLTLTLPIATTIATALDALSHAMEAIWNNNNNPVSDALGVEAIRTIFRSLAPVCASPSDKALRENLMHGATLAGLAFSNTRTAIAHSMSYPLTAQLGMPHGLACSFTLPEVLRISGASHPERVEPIIRSLGASSLEESIDFLYLLFRDIDLRALLREYLPLPSEFVGDFITPGRADNSLVSVTNDEARDLIFRAYSRIC